MITWKRLLAGTWTADFVRRPWAAVILAAGREWPGWRTGSPPTWEEVLRCDRLSFADRRALVAHVLAGDRPALIGWVTDCVEDMSYLSGPRTEEVHRTVAALRAWCVGEPADLGALRRHLDGAIPHAARAADAALAAAAAADALAAVSAGAAAVAEAADAPAVVAYAAAVAAGHIPAAAAEIAEAARAKAVAAHLAAALPYLTSFTGGVP